MFQGGRRMGSQSKSTRGGRPSALRPAQAVDEPGSPPRTSRRTSARTVARPTRPDRKAGRDRTPQAHQQEHRMEPIAPETFVGIDVSKARLDVAVEGGASFPVDNTPRGHAELVARLAPLRPRRVLLEATGGLESAAVAALCGAGLAVIVANPRQARDFAK